jgi:hypothetical protein
VTGQNLSNNVTDQSENKMKTKLNETVEISKMIKRRMTILCHFSDEESREELKSLSWANENLDQFCSKYYPQNLSNKVTGQNL